MLHFRLKSRPAKHWHLGLIRLCLLQGVLTPFDNLSGFERKVQSRPAPEASMPGTPRALLPCLCALCSWRLERGVLKLHLVSFTVSQQMLILDDCYTLVRSCYPCSF